MYAASLITEDAFEDMLDEMLGHGKISKQQKRHSIKDFIAAR